MTTLQADVRIPGDGLCVLELRRDVIEEWQMAFIGHAIQGHDDIRLIDPGSEQQVQGDPLIAKHIDAQLPVADGRISTGSAAFEAEILFLDPGAFDSLQHRLDLFPGRTFKEIASEQARIPFQDSFRIGRHPHIVGIILIDANDVRFQDIVLTHGVLVQDLDGKALCLAIHIPDLDTTIFWTHRRR